jgi:hypothetical protein
MSFSKNIFCVWFQGYDNIKDQKFKENLKNWKLLNPDWKFNFMDHNDLELACKTYSPECLKAYNRFDTLHLKVDIGKIVALYLYGGIIIDIDQYALRSLKYSNVVNQIIDSYNKTKRPILGISEAVGNTMEKMIQKYGNATMIASPRNPLLKKWIDTVISSVLTIREDSSDFAIISQTSGPIKFSSFMRNNMKSVLSDIVSIDYSVFEPCLLSGDCQINENTISVHKFEISWVPKKFKFVIDIYYGYIRQNFVLIFLIIAAVICYRYSSKTKRIK